jgi:hypothetical protein
MLLYPPCVKARRGVAVKMHDSFSELTTSTESRDAFGSPWIHLLSEKDCAF